MDFIELPILADQDSEIANDVAINIRHIFAVSADVVLDDADHVVDNGHTRIALSDGSIVYSPLSFQIVSRYLPQHYKLSIVPDAKEGYVADNSQYPE